MLYAGEHAKGLQQDGQAGRLGALGIYLQVVPDPLHRNQRLRTIKREVYPDCNQPNGFGRPKVVCQDFSVPTQRKSSQLTKTKEPKSGHLNETRSVHAVYQRISPPIHRLRKRADEICI